MPKSSLRLVAALLGVALIAGCAMRGQAPGIVDFDFRVRGKIAVRGIEAPFAATFDWRQAGERFEIDIWGALGQGRVRLDGDGRALRITDPRGRITRGMDAETLMQRELGWSVPVDALRHWVRGRRHPGATEAERQTSFEQFGWSVAIAWGEDEPQPARLVVSRDDVRITLVCKEWMFAAAG